MNTEDTLVVIGYASDSVAQTARERLQILSVEDQLAMDLAAYMTKDQNGKIKLEQGSRRSGLRSRLGKQSKAQGVASQDVEDVAGMVQPGEAALFLLVHDVTRETVVPEIMKYGGTVLKTSLPAERERLLRAALSGELTSEQIVEELERNPPPTRQVR